jgi:hypothetical protein
MNFCHVSTSRDLDSILNKKAKSDLPEIFCQRHLPVRQIGLPLGVQ